MTTTRESGIVLPDGVDLDKPAPPKLEVKREPGRLDGFRTNVVEYDLYGRPKVTHLRVGPKAGKIDLPTSMLERTIDQRRAEAQVEITGCVRRARNAHRAAMSRPVNSNGRRKKIEQMQHELAQAFAKAAAVGIPPSQIAADEPGWAEWADKYFAR